jgi:hypothetical protein
VTGHHPTAGELLAALQRFLDAELTPALEGWLRYQTRVAAHVVAQLEREWRLAPDHAAAHAERLARLGVADDRELAAAIRAGRLDDRHDEVLAALRAAARDRLAVVNPDWLEDPPAGG